MARIEWQKAFETGIPQIDEQNRGLISLINKLELASGTRDSVACVQETLISLVNHVRYHFPVEEKLMAENRYPQVDYHAELHLQFITEVAEFLRQLKSGKTISVKTLLSFLKGHLTNHVMREDTKLRQYADPAAFLGHMASASGRKTGINR